MRTTTTPATVSAPAASLRRKSVWRRSMAYVLPVESGGAGALAGEVDGGAGGGEEEDHAVAGAEPAQGPVVLPAEQVEGRAGRRERGGGHRGGGGAASRGHGAGVDPADGDRGAERHGAVVGWSGRADHARTGRRRHHRWDGR